MSILIARDGLSFYISAKIPTGSGNCVERKFNSPKTPGEILEQIESTLQDENIFLEEMETISIVYANNLYCFVPAEFFDENHLSDYLKFNAKILTTDFLAHDFLKNKKYVNVFVPYANINNYFFERFGSFEYKHSASVLAENLLSKNKSKEEIMYVQVFWNHFDLVVLKKDKLLLCNSFLFETPEDFVYYILFVAEQLKLDPENFVLNLSGKISEDSENYKLLRDYVRNCAIVKNEWEISSGKHFSFNAQECE
ncbi:MAG TPA: DUF3822 family protein [Flavobacteriaceae bacterium]|nr:DUF3822 family protein [Flavobacteriaceae bacterium]